MATIRTETVCVNHVPFKKVIQCTGHGAFKVKVPADVALTLGISDTLEADTLAKLESLWCDTVERYENACTETTKVIIYQIQAQRDVSFSYGGGVFVYARVYSERKTLVCESPAKYHYDYREVAQDEDLPSLLRLGHNPGIHRYDRILALKEAKRHGIGTWASIEPVVNPASSLKLIALAAPVCGHFKIGALNRTQDNPELARLAAGIGWRDFGRRAIELCESAGRTYFIKDDLAKYLDGVKYTNTDTRILQRKDGGS